MKLPFLAGALALIAGGAEAATIPPDSYDYAFTYRGKNLERVGTTGYRSPLRFDIFIDVPDELGPLQTAAIYYPSAGFEADGYAVVNGVEVGYSAFTITGFIVEAPVGIPANEGYSGFFEVSLAPDGSLGDIRASAGNPREEYDVRADGRSFASIAFVDYEGEAGSFTYYAVVPLPASAWAAAFGIAALLRLRRGRG